MAYFRDKQKEIVYVPIVEREIVVYNQYYNRILFTSGVPVKSNGEDFAKKALRMERNTDTIVIYKEDGYIKYTFALDGFKPNKRYTNLTHILL